jgi:DNA-binding NarL/FixJ family response regulator
MIRVLVCDDNAVVREGLVAVLEAEDDLRVVGRAADGRQAVDETRRASPDVVLLDVRMPGRDGIAAATEIAPLAKVLMLTYTDDEQTIEAALRAGASGYLVHGQDAPDRLADAIRDVRDGRVVLGSVAANAVVDVLRSAPLRVDMAGHYGVTRREAEVLDALAEGNSNAQIAEQLFLSPKTVKNHLHNAYAKLGATSRAEAIARWLRGPLTEREAV